LKAIRVGLDERIGKRIGNRAARILVIVLQLRLIQLIVLKALTEAINVVHMRLEGGTPRVFRSMGSVSLNPRVIPSSSAATFIASELLSHDLTIYAVAVVNRFECGLLLRCGRLGGAGAVDAQRTIAQRTNRGNAEPELAG